MSVERKDYDTLYRCAECRCRRFIEGGTFVEVGIGNYDFICTACKNRIIEDAEVE